MLTQGSASTYETSSGKQSTCKSNMCSQRLIWHFDALWDQNTVKSLPMTCLMQTYMIPYVIWMKGIASSGMCGTVHHTLNTRRRKWMQWFGNLGIPHCSSHSPLQTLDGTLSFTLLVYLLTNRTTVTTTSRQRCHLKTRSGWLHLTQQFAVTTFISVWNTSWRSLFKDQIHHLAKSRTFSIMCNSKREVATHPWVPVGVCRLPCHCLACNKWFLPFQEGHLAVCPLLVWQEFPCHTSPWRLSDFTGWDLSMNEKVKFLVSNLPSSSCMACMPMMRSVPFPRGATQAMNWKTNFCISTTTVAHSLILM